MLRTIPWSPPSFCRTAKCVCWVETVPACYPHTLQVVEGALTLQPLQEWFTIPGGSSGLPRGALAQQVRELAWASLAAESVHSDCVLQDWEDQRPVGTAVRLCVADLS